MPGPPGVLGTPAFPRKSDFISLPFIIVAHARLCNVLEGWRTRHLLISPHCTSPRPTPRHHLTATPRIPIHQSTPHWEGTLTRRRVEFKPGPASSMMAVDFSQNRFQTAVQPPNPTQLCRTQSVGGGRAWQPDPASHRRHGQTGRGGEGRGGRRGQPPQARAGAPVTQQVTGTIHLHF